MVKLGYETEVRRKKELESKGWVVFRVSGSIGAFDLIAIKPSTSDLKVFIVVVEQVKKITGTKFYFDERSKDEVRRMKELYMKSGVTGYLVIYYKIKNRFIVNIHNVMDINEDFKRLEVSL